MTRSSAVVNVHHMESTIAACIYCQSRKGDTEDHVPPKAWVLRALWPDILRVPTCRPCNQSFMRDDEYVRAKLLLRPDVGSNPALSSLLDSVVRGVWKPEAQGFKNLLLNEFRSVEAVTDAGLYAGYVAVPTADPERLHKAIERIVRALYYHETGAPLPTGSLVTVDVAFEHHAAQQATARRYLGGQTSKGICGDTLRYVWRQARENAQGSVWMIVLYDAVPFFAVTVGPEDADNVRQSADIQRRLLLV